MGSELTCYRAHQSTKCKLQKPPLWDETEVQNNCGFGELYISPTECLCKILSLSLHFFTCQNIGLFILTTAHIHIQNNRPPNFGEKGLHRTRLQRTVTGPLEHLLTNYPRVCIFYVIKEETMSDFSKAVFSSLWNTSLSHDAINCQESAEACRIRKL